YGSRPARDGERKPYGRPDGERKSYGSRPARDGERKPYGRPDRADERKPYGRPDGERKPYGSRPARDGERKPYGRPDRAGERKPHQGGARTGDHRSAGRVAGRPAERRPREDAGRRPGAHGAAELQVRPRHDDPEIPERIEPKDLDRSARAELKTLTKENADWVARHLVAAAEALEDDPALAHRHALSASRRAGRIGVVRETLAITAYATGDFALALRELRTFRRISGSDEQLPLMVDSERGVGRPDRALELGRSVDRSTLPASVQVALAIAMSGARLDLDQPDLALAELEIPQLDPDRAFSYSPALFSAYAEVLEQLGRSEESASWRERAQRAEAALAGDGFDLVEVYDFQGDEPADADGAAKPVVAASAAGRSTADPDLPESAAPDLPESAQHDPAEGESSDPADAMEPEVAAILAETADPDTSVAEDDDTETERG
ncbi:primosomal protein, partial [Agromyces sp. ZXT2-6]